MESAENTRARALIAIGALLALGVLVGVILVASSGSNEAADVAAAPAECIDSWNSDPKALADGAHNNTGHGYVRVQVAYANGDASEIDSEPIAGGGCIVVFASGQLDPEPAAAAEIEVGNSWKPASVSTDEARLAELQGAAVGAANATVGPDGRITSL